MRFQEIYKNLIAQKYIIFSFEDLCVFYPNEKRSSLQQYLSRWKKQGLIRSLRKGLYELTFPEARDIPDLFIANKIYAPSYVSLETALCHYSIIPEVSIAVMSISSKATRRFKNAHGLFLYRSICADAFCGYIIEKHNGFNVFIAEPEKALADYLYFKTLRNKTFNKDAERIDLKRVKKLNKKKLNYYAAMYHLNLKELLYAGTRSIKS